MAHHQRRNAADPGSWSNTTAKTDDNADYRASRVRSREEKDHAAREAQRRAAANRDEVLRETARMSRTSDRNEKHLEDRRRGNDNINATLGSQNNERGTYEQSSNAVRFSSPPSRPEDSKHGSAERAKCEANGHRLHDRRSPQSHSPTTTSTSWTSRLKAFTSSSDRDRPARTETNTTVFQKEHCHHHRRRSKERVRPQDTPSASQSTHAGQPGHPCPRFQPPLPPQPPSFPTMPPQQPAPQYHHITHSSSSNRIDVYLDAGPSDWHVRDGNTMPIPTSPPHPPFPPATHQHPLTFPTQQPPAPAPHLRNPDFFGPIAMHCLNSVGHAAQHQHQHQHQQQNHLPQQHQPQRTQEPPPRPPKVPHDSPGTDTRNAQQQAQQKQQQQQLPPSQQQAYPVPKNRMPVWDDQAQTVRWEWR